MFYFKEIKFIVLETRLIKSDSENIDTGKKHDQTQ